MISGTSPGFIGHVRSNDNEETPNEEAFRGSFGFPVLQHSRRRHSLAADPAKIQVGILLPLTGTFAAVVETQRDGALLAIDVINKRGGLDMPGGKVMVEGVVADDEAKQDVGVRRCRYMVSEGVKGVGGQTWAPLAYAINAMVSKEPMFTITFIIAGTLSGLAGGLHAPLIMVDPQMGIKVLAFVLMVVIIGGLGSIKGILISAFIVGQVVSIGSLIYAPLAQMAPFAIMLLILLVKPTGLYGSALGKR